MADAVAVSWPFSADVTAFGHEFVPLTKMVMSDGTPAAQTQTRMMRLLWLETVGNPTTFPLDSQDVHRPDKIRALRSSRGTVLTAV
jgi:hypothetical protein